jgi:hypothetical protein
MKTAESKKLSTIEIPSSTLAGYSHIPIQTGNLLSLIAAGLQERSPSMDFLSAVFDALSAQDK